MKFKMRISTVSDGRLLGDDMRDYIITYSLRCYAQLLQSPNDQ